MADMTLVDGKPETARQRADRLRLVEFRLEQGGEALGAQRAVTELEFRLKSTAVNKGLIASAVALASGQVTLGGFGTATLLTYKSVELTRIETTLERQTAAIDATKAELKIISAEIVEAEAEAEREGSELVVRGSDKLNLDMPDMAHMDDPPTKG